ncbi:MAG: preprotein translocase subunit SecA [SAR324 cluster bacterium]|nr:preprotein translocase subunit SecA [SAR324 cluster bacterium]
MFKFLKEKIIGTHSSRKLKEYSLILAKINEKRDLYDGYSADDVAKKTAEFKERLTKGESIDSLIPEAFSLVRYAANQSLGQIHFDVQLLGGLALHFGNIAEMKTGEGKTLTSTLAIYLNSLHGKGVHVVTVNEYLAKRDSKWMGEIFTYLGLKVGLIGHNQGDTEKREAYAADVTYGTNNEYGFDYLRDNMKSRTQDLVQREPFYAIIDEVDSILIDESRTPLIISGAAERSTDHYQSIQNHILGLERAMRNVEKPSKEKIAKFFNIGVDKVAEKLINFKDDTVVTDGHYSLDEKSRLIQLTEQGSILMEERLKDFLKGGGLYDIVNVNLLHHVNQALKANYIFKSDVDYIMDNSKVKIVDEFTGRIMEGRRFSDGLHQALEAKERVQVQRENQTLASITFQNYFRRYKKLSGMTGTAATEENEFIKIYNLGVIIMPTNMPMVRKDHTDLIYKNSAAKHRSIVKKVRELNIKGQPVLVGTDSIENSEYISKLLSKERIIHDVLNAKNHSREAEIISNAGQKGRVTIATNMAGRGTDIQLADGVVERGGLFILGTVRHESRRIDNQLRGRSGRQGDPGESRFYLSLDDNLLRVFGGERIARLMNTLKINEDEPIEHSLINRAIENAQVKVEAHNFAIRKHLLDYDDVINRQREVIYHNRQEVLTGMVSKNFESNVLGVGDMLYEQFFVGLASDQWDMESFHSNFRILYNTDFGELNGDQEKKEDVRNLILSRVQELLNEKREYFGEALEHVERHVSLSNIDSNWKNHLVAIDQLKESVGLRGYAQRNPLDEYKKEAYTLFKDMMELVSKNMVQVYFKALLKKEVSEELVEKSSLGQIKMTHGPMPGVSITNNNRQNQEQKNNPALDKRKPLIRSQPKIGRNDACFCGSGKKYKNCHGKL